MDREAGDVGLPVRPAHRPVHRLDDVAAEAEVAQGRLDAWLQCPLRRAHLLGEAQPFELSGTAKHETAHLRMVIPAWPQLGDTAAIVRDITQRAVEAGPAFGLNLLFPERCEFRVRCGDRVRR